MEGGRRGRGRGSEAHAHGQPLRYVVDRDRDHEEHYPLPLRLARLQRPSCTVAPVALTTLGFLKFFQVFGNFY